MHVRGAQFKDAFARSADPPIVLLPPKVLSLDPAFQTYSSLVGDACVPPHPPSTPRPGLKLPFWFEAGDASAWLPGVWLEDLGDAFPEGSPPLPGKADPGRRQQAAAASRACSLARTKPAAPARSARARRPPALPAGAGRSPRPGAGWLCQSPRAWAAAHVSRRHVRARPRGLRQLPLQKLVGWGSAHRSGSGPRTPPGGGHRAGSEGAEGSLERRGPSESATPQHHELTSLFECPVCFDYVLPPILQCQAGHLVCNQCRQKLSCCPTCRGALTPSIRNLAMEKVASAVLFPCKYATTGCSLTLHHTEKPEHEDICEYRPYSCPCPGASCKWQGSLEAVMSHLMHAHKSITTLQGEDIVFLATDINLPGAVDWVMMQSCFGHHFMLVLEKQEKYEGHQQFFAIVLLIGTRKQAENFAYRLELNGNRRRLTWEATPRSIHDGVAAAIMNSDCLVFDTAIAHLFADNGNLGINVTISTCCP
ncbi:E3 ubiquitin-protein ligase SIAH2 [Trichechus manatus latirostris]|uniref:E3 ubiquitin-protein ligase n=1 Tax=Trichechus manatus latirostris TaxID=127582 RepID=A0A2Y9R874_TRIMA|nr:E3 ubiquitin-protein ligase SIAH2 [Trichechus manatus latirostris]